MDAGSVRQAFLNHLEENRHALIGGSSLIPEHDPSVLFTTAGMHPLVPFLLGEPHPAGAGNPEKLPGDCRCRAGVGCDQAGRANGLVRSKDGGRSACNIAG